MRHRSCVLSSLQACGLVALIAPGAFAQCNTSWLPGSVAGVLGTVHAATTWDPDGAGPQPPLVVMGGDFTFAGPIAAKGIVGFDPVAGTWSTFGSGFDDGFVSALAVMPSGELVAAGWFTASGGVAMNRIARWNGTAWLPLGQGLSNIVNALAVLPSGVLIAGGQFTQAGGVSAIAIASWDGVAWSAFPSVLAPEYPSANPPSVGALAVRQNGSLVVGGSFWYAGGQLAQGIAEWNGTAWSPLGVGTIGFITDLKIAANGDVLAGGSFAQIGGMTANGVARWNGSAWSSFASGPGLNVRGIHELANGNVLAGGGATGGPSGAQRAVRQWGGATWTDLHGAPTYGQPVWCIEPALNGDVLVGGDLMFPIGARGFGLLSPNLTWVSWPIGFNGGVYAIHRLPNGDLLVGGDFDQVPGAVANRVARFDGVAWSNLGGGLGGTIQAIAHLANGDPVAAASGAGAGVYRWNGAMWLPLGAGLSGGAYDLQLMPNGDLIAAHGSSVMRWDGVNWTQLGSLNGLVRSLAVLNDGTLAAAGYFTGGVATWDGTTWNVLGGGAPGATGLAVTTNGDLIVIGYSTIGGALATGNIARWDGMAWQTLGAGVSGGVVNAVAATADGGVAVVGSFTAAGGVPAAGKAARWDGAAWHALGAGLWNTPNGPPYAAAIEVAPNGDVSVGGLFAGAAGHVSMNFARWTTSCPAGALVQGAGCVGSGGLGALGMQTPAWVGGAFATRATGMPALGLAVSVTGFVPLAVPLAAVLPPSPPACTLLVTPDLLGLHVPLGGVADVALALPNNAALAGLSFRQQVVAIELGAGGSFAQVTSTNALLATIGSY